MILIEVKVVDGVQFLIKAQLVEPYEYRHGVMIELVSYEAHKDKTLKMILKMLGFKEVGWRIIDNNYLYVRKPWGYAWYKFMETLLEVNWKLEVFLYDNARFFKQIPQGERFSWRYFTPYTWLLALKKRFSTGTFR